MKKTKYILQPSQTRFVNWMDVSVSPWMISRQGLKMIQSSVGLGQYFTATYIPIIIIMSSFDCFLNCLKKGPVIRLLVPLHLLLTMYHIPCVHTILHTYLLH